MMSLPIRPQPLRKLPVVWHCPCRTVENLLFSFSFLSVSLRVYAQYSFMCLYMKWVTGVGWGGHSFMLHPQPWWTHSLSAASANIDQAKCCAVQEQKERKKGLQTCYHYVIFRGLLSFDSFDPQLWTQTSHKDFFEAHLCSRIAAFVQTIADMDLWRHF